MIPFFDDYKISGRKNLIKRYGEIYTKPVPDKQADFWSLHGLIAKNNEWHWIGDFRSPEYAEVVEQHLRGA